MHAVGSTFTDGAAAGGGALTVSWWLNPADGPAPADLHSENRTPDLRRIALSTHPIPLIAFLKVSHYSCETRPSESPGVYRPRCRPSCPERASNIESIRRERGRSRRPPAPDGSGYPPVIEQRITMPRRKVVVSGLVT